MSHSTLKWGPPAEIAIDSITGLKPFMKPSAKNQDKPQSTYIDETSHRQKDKLQWLWVMANTAVAFFMIHLKRSKKAFQGAYKGLDGQSWSTTVTESEFIKNGQDKHKPAQHILFEKLQNFLKAKTRRLPSAANGQKQNCSTFAIWRIHHLPQANGMHFMLVSFPLISMYEGRKDDEGSLPVDFCGKLNPCGPFLSKRAQPRPITTLNVC